MSYEVGEFWMFNHEDTWALFRVDDVAVTSLTDGDGLRRSLVSVTTFAAERLCHDPAFTEDEMDLPGKTHSFLTGTYFDQCCERIT